jgi:glycine/D-amino acid oxidase-like deaminating enzyme
MLRTTPFWRDDRPRPADLPVAALPEHTAVAVVGAGFTGLSAARVLAGAGTDVVVIDGGPVGAGASSVNGGMVNYGLKASTAKVFKRYGAALGREFWDASLRSIDLVEEIVATEGIDCAFTRGGAAELGYRERDLDAFAEEAQWMEETLGFSTELVGPADIGSVVGSERFHCALVDRVGAGLHPARYVYGLAAAAAAKGARIVENAEVKAISRHTGGYQLLTTRGKLSAETVLLATNGYTGVRPVPQLRRRVVPIGSYIVVTEPLPTADAERLVPRNRMLWTSRRFINYFRRTPDDRILMGGRNDLSTDLDLVESAAILTATARDIYPELADVAFTHSWTGKLGVTFDLMPHIGHIDGMWYALGYGGHGVGIGTYLGTEVGRRISGDLDRSPFEEIPHPTRPYYRSHPWFLPAAARWYRLLDAVGR